MIICWICKSEEATTGVHSIKASDVKAVLRKTGPYFKHNDQHINHKVQDVKSKEFTFNSLIGPICNNKTTQPYDFAWEAKKVAAKSQPSLFGGDDE